MGIKWLKQAHDVFYGIFIASIRSYISRNIWTHQPCPYRTLVLCLVSFVNVTTITANIIFIFWRKRSQTVWRQKVFTYYVGNIPPSFHQQHRIRQAYSKYLVWANSGNLQLLGSLIIKVMSFLKPERFVKRFF